MDMRSGSDSNRRSDGEETHAEILEAAMRVASMEGLGSLTFGRLAAELDISKSGVFAHFRSKQHLQRETIAAAREVFDREVLQPAMTAREGRARLESLCEAYLSYVRREVFPGGCFFAQLLAEFDAPTGPIHDQVEAGQRGWLSLVARQVETAQRNGELDPAVDPQQLAFEVYAPVELANYLFTLFRDPAMIERGQHAVRASIARAAHGAAPRRREQS